MKRHSQVGKGTQRWLLTLLCLLASFAYLARQTEQRDMTPAQVAAMSAFSMTGGQPSGMSVMNMHSVRSRPLATPALSSHRNLSVPHASRLSPSSSAVLVTSPPNAPPQPADHNHAGHCPFCFAAAFALEAEWDSVAVTDTALGILTEWSHMSPALPAVDQPVARGPPVRPEQRPCSDIFQSTNAVA
jgi:hypothetical protein